VRYNTKLFFITMNVLYCIQQDSKCQMEVKDCVFCGSWLLLFIPWFFSFWVSIKGKSRYKECFAAVGEIPYIEIRLYYKITLSYFKNKFSTVLSENFTTLINNYIVINFNNQFESVDEDEEESEDITSTSFVSLVLLSITTRPPEPPLLAPAWIPSSPLCQLNPLPPPPLGGPYVYKSI